MSSLLAVSALLASVSAPSAAASETWSFHLDHVLGTSFDMAVEGGSRAEAEFAFAAAASEIARLDRVLSGWRADSELSALNRAAERRVSPDLFAVLSACESWRTRTGGAFSARLGVAEGLGEAEAICAAVAHAEAADVGLDRATRTVSRPEGVTFAVDGLAKGYVIDAALSAARRAAPCARAMMIDIGGDIACFGDRAWSLGVADPANLADNAAPAAVVRVSNGALAVSGPGMRDRLVDGAVRSHLTDPATGAPGPARQAAVLAADA
ncbi:FAD:protein FMN transferase, partial [Phenylobacterium sp.]|uniref:FAD:protein FMN transferase n=1 Tax=Phenylobacterium sp. TaxID=1871053 RepID=UPI0025EF735C